MGKLSGEFREPNRKDKVTRFPSVTYARQLGLLVNALGSHLESLIFQVFIKCNATSHLSKCENLSIKYIQQSESADKTSIHQFTGI